MEQSEVVEILIEAGRNTQERLDIAVPLLMKILPHIPGFRDLDAITKQLSTEDVVSLTRGLALAESLPGKQWGSITPVPWAFQELELRGYPGLLALLNWIIEHDPNDYTCYKCNELGERLYNLKMLHEEQRSLAATKFENTRREDELRLTMPPMEYERAYGAWLASTLEAQAVQSRENEARHSIAALQRKLAEMAEELAALRCRLTRTERAQTRAALLIDGAALDPVERLRLVAARPNIPIAMVPADWACLDPTVLVALDRGTRQALASRLEDRKKGPWRKMYRALRELGIKDPS